MDTVVGIGQKRPSKGHQRCVQIIRKSPFFVVCLFVRLRAWTLPESMVVRLFMSYAVRVHVRLCI